MLLSVQQKYILDVLQKLGCARKRQLHVLVREKFRRPDLEISEVRLETMLRQLRCGQENIRTAFKKMAIINPDRNRAQAVVSQPTEAVEPEKQADIRVVESREKRAVYDGLLEKSILETKQKKPKRRELEDQISLFGNAA